MANLLNPTKKNLNEDLGIERVEKLIEDSPEIKSYIYQQIVEFEPFVTPETVVAVFALDPKKLKLQFQIEGKDDLIKDLNNLYRIGIVLKDSEAQLKAEATDYDLFAAIRKAKENLLVQLADIQDKVITSQERIEQINSLMQNNEVH